MFPVVIYLNIYLLETQYCTCALRESNRQSLLVGLRLATVTISARCSNTTRTPSSFNPSIPLCDLTNTSASNPYPKLNPYRAQTTIELISVIYTDYNSHCSAVAVDI
ncbi:hypothetical protein BOTNAR_0026g00070 [Botryotinia narcissicola]|uniref:Uncharacterized protein n=1 Tax=Botryotinia narcissicola TaxID=278944 RepID=A0A4Z1J9V4_9HELO|nr:hypothetical protein BOTNAR_0026g00070 [Botryotinia narcissicola]